MKKTSRVLLFLFIGPALTYAQSPLTGTWQNEVLSRWVITAMDGGAHPGRDEPDRNRRARK